MASKVCVCVCLLSHNASSTSHCLHLNTLQALLYDEEIPAGKTSRLGRKLKLFSAEQTKDLKFGYKLEPRFLGGLQTFISINKIKTPFWWPGSNGNLEPPQPNTAAAFGSTAIGNAINGPYHNPTEKPALDDDIAGSSGGVNSTEALVPDDAIRLPIFSDSAIFNQPLIGYIKAPVGVVQNAGNFELNIAGGLFRLAKTRYKLEAHRQ